MIDRPVPAPPRAARVTGPIEGWGRLTRNGVQQLGEDLLPVTDGATLSRGLGRAYGDAALPAGTGDVLATTTLADRLLSFDPGTGVLHAEAGLALREMNRLFLPRRWFTPVSPGTAYVTLGGMVAADIHGKGHHSEGTIGGHLRQLTLRLADGSVVTCSPQERADLFWATVGGMGLTGHILDVALRLRRLPSPWIWSESERVPNIHRFLQRLAEQGARLPMSVGWIDCLTRGPSMGRGILDAGRWAEEHEAPPDPPRPKRRLTVPDLFPNWTVSRAFCRAFNTVWYWKHWQAARAGVVHPESFFYPLDMLARWNRIYGRRGFTQYQCVLPTEAGPDAPVRFLELLTRLGGASFLCVIKDCGPQGQGLLSFPKRGITIALDIRVTDGTQALVDRLNEFLIEAGGRVYLAKDQFTRPEHFAAMEPRLPAFLAARRRWDPKGRFRSAQSVRLFGDSAG